MENKFLKDNGITYKVKVTKRKNFAIKYNQKSELIILCPHKVTSHTIDDLIERNKEWIIRHKPQKEQPKENYNDGDMFLLFGKKIPIRIIYNKHEDVQCINDTLYVYTNNDQNVKSLIKKYCYNLAEFTYNEMMDFAFHKIEEIKTTYPKLIIKESVRNWGYCKIRLNVIMLNLSLVHVPKDLIMYVVFHELCHLVVPNHSKEFHALLQKYIPDEKASRKFLLKYSIFF